MTRIKQISKNVFQVIKTVNITERQWDRWLSAEDSKRIKQLKTINDGAKNKNNKNNKNK